MTIFGYCFAKGQFLRSQLSWNWFPAAISHPSGSAVDVIHRRNCFLVGVATASYTSRWNTTFAVIQVPCNDNTEFDILSITMRWHFTKYQVPGLQKSCRNRAAIVLRADIKRGVLSHVEFFNQEPPNISDTSCTFAVVLNRSDPGTWKGYETPEVEELNL